MDDLLIVGAGPTGLMMAAESLRYGMSCAIIEEKALRSENSKAIAIQSRTMEIFHFLGLSEAFLARGIKLKAANPGTFSKQIAHLDFSLLDSPFPFVLSLEQSKTEAILENHLNALGLQVAREKSLVALEEHADHVRASVKNLSTGNIESLKARFVIGCDGAHSFVRKFLHLSFKGRAFSDIFSLADVTLDWKYPHDEVFAFLDAKGVVAAIPLPANNCYRLIFQLERCRDALDKNNLPLDPLATEGCPTPTLEEIQKMLHRFGDPRAKVSHPLWIANFHINSRLTSRYQKGRFFLAGDAAHIHSPVGGQGMNIGLQDAFNLAWKLAFTLNQGASPKLLSSYHEERHALAKHLLKTTEKMTRVVTLHSFFMTFIRNHLASFILKLEPIRKRLVKAISQTAIQLPNSISKGSFSGGIEAGLRAADFSLVKEDQETSLFYLLRNPKSYFLLLFSGINPSSQKMKELLSYSPSTELYPITLIVILHAEKRSGCLLDPLGKAHHKYGAEKGALYLLRPDTYITYRQTPLPKAHLLKALLLSRIKKPGDEIS